MDKTTFVPQDKTVSKNPATGEIIGEFRIHSEEEVRNFIQIAKQAQKDWGTIPLRKRKKHILKIRDYIVENADHIAATISRDNGKTRVDALVTEVLPAAIAANYYAKNAHHFLRPQKLKSSAWILAYKRSKIYRRPFGVVGIISPWNYPFAIPFSEVVMALLAGNAVILKTASETQLVGHLLKECISAGDLPPGIFQYVNLPGSKAGKAFLEGGVDKLFFTGSVETGKRLMEMAAKTLTPVSLELGGNDAMIVLDDADLERAANGAIWAGMQNAGQSCGGVERIYVDEKVHSDFLNILKEKISRLRVGPDTDWNVDIGAITTEKQLQTIRQHVEEALKKGATIFARSDLPKNLNGLFYPPTVLVDVNHDMTVMKDETFGPVLGVMPFKTVEEAIELANDSYLGLTASVWSKNRKKAREIASQIKAGAVTINDHLMSHGLAETPWGGFKQSGIGRTHGKPGFDEMTEPQVIVDDVFSFLKKQLWWHPFSKNLYDGIKGLLHVLYGGFASKLKSIPAIIKILPGLFK
jgi:succinate-semialdehyde dehydrogenase/glutarate-semialdehyde dehydrogenase